MLKDRPVIRDLPAPVRVPLSLSRRWEQTRQSTTLALVTLWRSLVSVSRAPCGRPSTRYLG